jgi:hypothetical protein
MLITFLLQACSGIPFLGATLLPTDTPGPTATATITSTPTITPTATTVPSVTPSPTIVHFPTQDPNLPTATFIPIPIFIGNDTATPDVPPTPFKPGPGFDTVDVSDHKVFWGNCNPNKVKITAQVEDPEAVASVVVFVQLKSTKEEDYTPWSSGDVMFNYGGGFFSYTLKVTEIDGHNHYKDSWIRYQLVATDIDGEEIGRTMIYTETITLSPCMCYEPLAPSGCPIDTPRANK